MQLHSSRSLMVLSSSAPSSSDANKDKSNLEQFWSASLRKDCLHCPLSRAPKCFRICLVRALELGENNFLPTNWRGFSDFFHLQGEASGAEEAVEVWADRHPHRDRHTLQQVVDYAQKINHVKLLRSWQQALRSEQ